MSGGHYNYLYRDIDAFADAMLQDNDPIRRAFGQHLVLVSQAMHDIEFVDSGDYGIGDEHKAIQKALGDKWREKTLAEFQVAMETLYLKAMEIVGDKDAHK